MLITHIHAAGVALRSHGVHAVQHLDHIWHTTPPEALELPSGLMALLWGLILWHRPHLFASSAAYSLMATAPEWAWALLATSAGLGQLAGALWPGLRRVRSVAGTLAYILWACISLGLAGVGVTTGLAVYPVLLIGSLAATVKRREG